MADVAIACNEATPDFDDWSDFSHPQDVFPLTEQGVKNVDTFGLVDHFPSANNSLFEEFTTWDTGNPTEFRSMFDIVPEFVFACSTTKSGDLQATQFPIQDTLLDNCQTWWKLATSYGNAMPVDWSKCYMRELQIKALRLREKQADNAVNLDAPDDEELSKAFDVHCIITSKVRKEDDEIETADEVISEIDSIMRMQESMLTATTDDGYITECDMMSSVGSDCLYFRETPSGIAERSMKYEDGLRQLSVLRLNELLDDVQSAIEERSVTLVRELALRDELEYSLELKNQFIALCHNVMKKHRQGIRHGPGGSVGVDGRRQSAASSSGLKKGATAKGREHAGAEAVSSTTYVIPYEPSHGPPSCELVDIYIKILTAMYNDSPTVPSLLTDYILKVVCPT